MPTRIADLRPDLTTLDDARAHFDTLARCVIALRAKDAACEKRIAEIKARHNEIADPLRAEIAELETQLLAFISANRKLFQSPRKVKTSLGAFGLQKVSELVVADPEGLATFLFENGYSECVKTVTKLLAPAIRTRVEDGENLPGCHIKTGDTAVYSVTKTLHEEPENDQAGSN